MAEILLVLIGLNALFLAWHEEYDDGFCGKVALAAIFGGVVIIITGEMVRTFDYEFSWETTLLIFGVWLFLARHTYRWMLHRRKTKGGAA